MSKMVVSQLGKGFFVEILVVKSLIEKLQQSIVNNNEKAFVRTPIRNF